MILTFSLKRSLPQSNKQATWHKADREGGSQVMSVKCGADDAWGGVTLGTLLPTLSLSSRDCLSFLFIFLLSSCVCCSVLVLSLRLYHGQEHTVWQSGEKTQGFPLYLCSQQGITLLLCPGSKPFAASSSSQDGSSLQGRGIFPLPPPQQVCVQASLFMSAHFMCFAVGSHRLPRGRMSPSAALTKAATVQKYNHLSVPSSSLLSLMEHCFQMRLFHFCLVWHLLCF